jgi:hypothetical protein
VTAGAITHLPSLDVLRKYMGEMTRVMKPGSICAITLPPARGDNLRPLMKLKGRIRDLWSDGPRGLSTDEWIAIRPTVEQVRALSSCPMQVISMGNERLLSWFVR